jgi:hypothetical protein
MIVFYALGQGPSPAPCAAPEYHQFDFWIGEWVVTDTTGKEVGQNVISREQDGCLLQEHWTAAGMTGTSFNYYAASDSAWHQLWVDNQGTQIILKGHLEQGRMVMRSDWQPGKKVDFYCNQITWTPQPNGNVIQHWTVIAKDGRVLATPFKGIYIRKP